MSDRVLEFKHRRGTKAVICCWIKIEAVSAIRTLTIIRAGQAIRATLATKVIRVYEIAVSTLVGGESYIGES